MKHLLFTTIVITSTAPWWAAGGTLDENAELLPGCTPQVVISTPAVAVTTGPFTMRVSTQPTSDCYQADGVNPNGSLVNERWVPCP